MLVNKRVLVIEDSEVLLDSLALMLDEAGFQAVPAQSLFEAKRHVAADPNFLCAVTDYHLPDGMAGESLPFLIEMSIPTIVLTGTNDLDVRERILAAPIFDYVPKDSPAAFDYTLKMVRRVERNRRLKVLVVDDAPAARTFLRRLLERQLYMVVEAGDAIHALAALRDHPDVRLVLADQEMPGMDGARMTTEIRRHYGPDRFAIIGVSGTSKPHMIARFIKAGADDFLAKPFNHEEFFTRVTRNIEFVENLQELRRVAYEDSLTGLPNRRSFFARLGEQAVPYGIAMLDVDFFKRVNDLHGHDVGDAALRHVAGFIKRFFADCLCARFGGEEFVLLLPGADVPAHHARLDAFRSALAESAVETERGQISVTVSIGLACAPGSNIDALLRDADEKLYVAKHQGRNQVCV